ncbi:uncharacterized protein PADG_11093 [Paracoccidioides brasiliensis Pb18]|uniref:Uncharacterized protein n=1 Tax=Paracoccidioides brasiliensis (strain Pb18) TaxID=502780 RepID=A0A0A0HX42_PARBD|nr:uncharacterized protein PADG_11093 [Paracoccidioides brasiliensis Pb18]KGM92641.1 hypothetical protein PADG_11093 [Paracoccidioides brasiliensis Pb18]
MRECSVIPFIPFHPVQFIILETQSHTSRKETNAKSEFFDTPGNFDCCWRQEDTGSHLQNYAGKSAHVERTATANKHTISALMESMPAGSLIQLNPNMLESLVRAGRRKKKGQYSNPPTSNTGEYHGRKFGILTGFAITAYETVCRYCQLTEPGSVTARESSAIALTHGACPGCSHIRMPEWNDQECYNAVHLPRFKPRIDYQSGS